LVGESHGSGGKMTNGGARDKAAADVRGGGRKQEGGRNGSVASAFRTKGKVFLNVRLTSRSNTLRTWRSGPQGSLEKNFKIFSKRRLTLRCFLAISPSP
jgi:hypothetical protein